MPKVHPIVNTVDDIFNHPKENLSLVQYFKNVCKFHYAFGFFFSNVKLSFVVPNSNHKTEM